MTRVILWRHGQTDFNVNRQVQGQVDIPLNEVGRSQAQRAAGQLAQVMPPDVIFSSPLSRAWDTARALGEACGLAPRLEERLLERSFGQWEGLNEEQIRQGWPTEFTEWRDWGDPDPSTGVEARQAVGQRVAQAVLEAVEAIESGKISRIRPETEEANVVFVSHGSAITQGVVTLLGLDASAWHGLRGLENCHWAVLRTAKRNPGWQLVGYNLGE